MVTSSRNNTFLKKKTKKLHLHLYDPLIWVRRVTHHLATSPSGKMIPPPPPSAKQHVNQTDASGLRKKSMMKEKGSSTNPLKPLALTKKSNYLTLIPDADRKISGSKPTANQVKKGLHNWGCLPCRPALCSPNVCRCSTNHKPSQG